MDILKQEILKKRQALSEETGGKKFFKRSEIEQKRLQKLREEEKHELEEKRLRQQQQQNQSGDATSTRSASAATSSSFLNSLCSSSNSDRSNTNKSQTLVSEEKKIDDLDLPKQEVIRRLRILRHPVTLFGEDDQARLDRLKYVLKAGIFEVDSDLMEGQTNDFLRDIVELKKRQKTGLLSQKRKRSEDLEDGDGGDGVDEDLSGDGGGGSSGVDCDKDVKRMKSKFEELCDEDKILVFFKRLLNEWNQELSEMPDTQRRTAKGKQMVATFKQCARYLNPLFKFCRKKVLPDDIKQALMVVVDCCMKRDYLAAMDQYIKMAIGNAPWPIGVTMVGIHERSAREKIYTNSVAHIMNDETTRKYLQSVKRLMTFCPELIRAIVGIALTWKARHTMDFIHILKYALKLIVAVIWTIVLPVCYAYTRRKYTCYGAQSGRWLGQWCYSSYMIAVAVYLMPNAVNMVLFLVPVAGRYIETSNCKICVIFSWWTQSRLYVGRGMQEDQVSVFKYTIFWFLLLLSKLSFSYYLEIKPLIEPTKQIMRIGVERYEWHELLPGVKSNAGAVVAVWAPIILVYFMDTQIWYSVFCTIFGGVYGILHHLGEIRTLGMLRSRFHSLPAAFNACLNPPSFRNGGERGSKYNFLHRFKKVPGNEKNDVRKFAIVWNHIINTFRSEDLISNREMDLMLFLLSSEIFSGQVRWPIFLLANKFSIALSIAKDFAGTDEYLLRKITKDFHMNCAVKECYESLKYILGIIIVGDVEKRILSGIIDEIEESILRSTLLEDICMSELPSLQAKCIELVELLLERNAHLKKAKVEGNACLEKEKVEGNARLEKEKVEENASHSKVVKVLQDIFELVTINMMANGSRTLDMLYSADLIEENIQPELFATNGSIQLPPEENGPLYDQIKRFHLLLTVEDTAMDIPANLDARRRISFFATSLFMNMPVAPKVQNMLSFSVLTPHYTEEVKFSMSELLSGQEQVSIIFYMQMIYPDEWKNFLERAEVKNLEALISEKKENELRDWTSFRGQTLSRTVRGMMYYREALKLQAFLDMAKDEDIQQGYEATSRRNTELPAILDALADMKFSYVVTCQTFGAQKASGDPRAQDIIDLMNRYPSLRLAYVEEKEVVASKEHPPVYSSVLVKGVNGYDQEIYRIKLPGTPNIGEGKPENQNHAIIFTRGEALQAIDMNQDNYFEEAFKMRNLLQEFHKGRPSPTILGLREHIFTGSVSSLAWFMSYQEKSFVTIGQRLLANLLRVRFHYGHSDLFDRVFHMTRGGISKASKTINLSEDVFAGFNSTLRRGYITYHEYMQVGKGRDVGLNQISKFEAKVANGNSEQTLSRDVHRLGCRFDFFRMLSFYFTTVGFYFNSLTSVIAVYVFLYGQLYLVLSGLQKALILEAKVHNIRSLETALASQSFIQLGLLTGLPMVMEIGLEKGFMIALQDFILMQFQLAAVFFTFSFGTKSHYYGRTILHGGAKYRPTGRKVVIFHASFTENYRLYSRSHFVKGFELILLLIVYDMFRKSYQSNVAYVLITYAMWFLSMSWLFAPFLFNPSGFNWQKIVEDWTDWDKWIRHQGGIGIHQDKSWESWWDDEQAHLRRAGLSSRLFEMLLSLRFFLYQYGLVYHLDISQQSKNFIVYVLSWIVIAVVFLLAKVVGIGRQFLSADHQFAYRLFKAIIFIAVLLTIITLSVICQLSLMDVVVCCLAFFPTGWGLLLVAQAVRPMIQNTGIWDFMQILARAYDYGMGVVLFFPIASLAWLPIISAFQTRFLFNPALKRQLQIQTILAGKKKNA